MWRELLPLCTTYRLNLIVTCHIKRLSEEAIEGAKDRQGKQLSVAKIQQDSDIAPQIVGSFKEAIEGKFGAVVYTDHQIKTLTVPKLHQQHVYLAYCNKTSAFESQANAKNKYNLPDILDVTGKSFYEELLACTGGLPIQAAAVAPPVLAQPAKVAPLVVPAQVKIK